jgi:hypothetical protein
MKGKDVGMTSALHADGSALTTETASGRSATRVALPNGTVVETVSDEAAGTATTTVILGLYPIVTLQYSATTSYQVS